MLKYESNDDIDKNLSLDECLDKIIDLQISDRWKVNFNNQQQQLILFLQNFYLGLRSEQNQLKLIEQVDSRDK